MKKKPPKISFSHEQIAKNWEKFQQINIREQYQQIKSIGYQVLSCYQPATVTLEQLLLYINIFKKVTTFDDSARYRIALNKMIGKYLEFIGADKAKILHKVNGKINIESGICAIGDQAIAIDHGFIEDPSDKNLVHLINQQTRFFFGIGGDGTIDVQLRLIEAAEPVLTPKEYKFVADTSKVAILKTESGLISAGDLTLDERNSVSIQVQPDNYKIAVFSYTIHHKEFHSFYIVLAKTETLTCEEIKVINQLES